MQKKRWSDLSAVQKAAIIVGGAIQIGLLFAGLWDLAHRKPEEVRGDRRMWAGLMFIEWLGPLAYFTYGRKNSPLKFWGCEEEEAPVSDETAVTEEIAWFGGPAVV